MMLPQRLLWTISFMLLPVLAIAYIGWHVWSLMACHWAWKAMAVALLACSFLLMFGGMAPLTNSAPLPLAKAVYEVGTSSVFVLLYLFMLFLVLDAGRLVGLVPRSWLHHNWWAFGAIAVLMLALFIYGNLHYRDKYRETLRVQTDKPLARPIRLLLASDLHIGYHNDRSELHRWVDLINSEQPDLILIAGDIIDMSMRPLREERMHEEFRRLKAPVYACLGNHEYYSGSPDARQFYRDAGIRLLMDSATVVGDLCIVGRDDRTNQHRQTLAAILKSDHGTPAADKFTIVLDHQPYHLEEAEQAGVDFQFSGHTHHGQVWPISWVTDAIYECSFGHHRRSHTAYYVSSGLGIWGGKFRIGTRSEYVVMTIEPKSV